MKKAQAALEYLMTYGWAILVIAIVAGALYYMNVFGGGCDTPTASGFSGVKVLANDWAVTADGALEMIITNGAAETVYITGFNITNTTLYENIDSTTLTAGETKTYAITGFDSGTSGECVTLDVDFVYTRGELATEMISTGKLRGPYQ